MVARSGKGAQNERLKLLAAFLNVVSIATFVAGAVLPSLSHYFEIGAPLRHPEFLLPQFAICMVVTGGLHSLAQMILGGILD